MQPCLYRFGSYGAEQLFVVLLHNRYQDALKSYTQAIEIEPSAALYSNRSACHGELEQWTEVLALFNC
jgi:hypothetical protein